MKTLETTDLYEKCFVCSTPFGICDEDTIGKRVDVLEVENLCSTPFGICDEDTDDNTSGWSVTESCSTPFGICDEDTCSISAIADNDLVLNAFRHL